jgi:hypothetical protein
MEISGLRNPGVMGTLANLGIPDIVQTLHLGLKTAVVTLKRKGEEAKIFFENGRVKHCAYGKWEGEDAFYELLRWTDGEFVIEHGIKTTIHSVSMDEMQMLMEGLRRLDESRKEDVSEKRL